MEWTHDKVFEFLALFKKEPVIWDPNHPGHKCRADVRQAWERIRNEFSGQCDIKQLKKKKMTLLSRFKQLMLKVKKSKLRSSDGEGIYKPKWFVYTTMEKFLGSVYEPVLNLSQETPANTTIDDQEVYEPIDIPNSESEISIETKAERSSELDSENIYDADKVVLEGVDHDEVNMAPEEINLSPYLYINTRNGKRIMYHMEPEEEEEEDIPYRRTSRKEDDDECIFFAKYMGKQLQKFNEANRPVVMHRLFELVYMELKNTGYIPRR